jgi:hypothetical protein
VPGLLNVDHATAVAAILGQLDRFVDAAVSASDRDLLAVSRCHGWAALDVVVHVRTGLQEMLGGVVTSTDARPDTDAATYWRAGLPSNDAVADDIDALLWTRRTASAYRRPSGATEHLRLAADAVAAGVVRMREGAVLFQGRVLASGDFLATWAVELAVHHLDLGRDVDFGAPTAEALRLGRATVEALAEGELPSAWSDSDCLLAGSGRIRLAPDVHPVASAAARLPVLG